MKKQVKIISIILVIMMALISISSVVYGADALIKNLEPKVDANKNGKIADFGQKIVAILTTVGIVAAVVILMVVGIKYMMGSAQEKAEYKKVMIPYLIGAALLFGASTIVSVVFNVITGNN